MAYSDYIITENEIQAAHVEAQPTVLRGTPTQNKQVFDKYCDLITDHFNDLVQDLDTSISPEIDDEVIQIYLALGWVNE